VPGISATRITNLLNAHFKTLHSEIYTNSQGRAAYKHGRLKLTADPSNTLRAMLRRQQGELVEFEMVGPGRQDWASDDFPIVPRAFKATARPLNKWNLRVASNQELAVRFIEDRLAQPGWSTVKVKLKMDPGTGDAAKSHPTIQIDKDPDAEAIDLANQILTRTEVRTILGENMDADPDFHDGILEVLRDLIGA